MVSIRKLVAIAIAFSVVIASAFTASGTAIAAMPHHAMEMAKADHCKGEHGRTEKSTAMACCAAMCVGVAVEPTPAAAVKKIAPALPSLKFIPTQPVAYLGEIATPPPRRA